MKNKHLLALSIALLLFMGCKKKLEEVNPSGVTDETLYKTPSGFESLVNAAYSYQRFWYGKEVGYAMTEAGTDLWAPGILYGDRAYRQLFDYDNLQGSNIAIQALWTRLYAAINLCNVGVARVGEAGFVPTVRTTREAELRFLRAFYYWHVVETWGDAPFTTSPTSSAVTTATRTKSRVIYDQIIADLEFACKNLPTTTADYGRATRYAALSFLSRVYLTRGYGNANDPDFPRDNAYFQKAMDSAKVVIDRGGFSLVKPYGRLWHMGNLKNPEVIYAVNYSSNTAFIDANLNGVPLTNFPDVDLTGPGQANINQYGGHNGHLLFVSRYEDFTRGATPRDILNGRPFSRYAPSYHLLNLFDETKDSRYEGSFQTAWIATVDVAAGGGYDAIKKGDTSLYVSKRDVPVKTTKYPLFDITDIYDEANNNEFKTTIAPVLRKFKDSTRVDVTTANSARDAYVIRFAELYLIAAEASFQLGNTSDAATFINVVRRRAGKPGLEPQMDINAGEVTLDFILDERGREFAGEQMRWFDLKRTGKLQERITKYNPNIAKNFIPATHGIRPIPQIQMDAVSNKGEFRQNPGYQ
ncbi:MAG TPA: RagB/SusD family nutrient uptake outer membrane protein [Cytophagales bacterium]|nr:RagB/SusD family nutrient uptake outer membrane protein [Cytophagales bacterium]